MLCLIFVCLFWGIFGSKVKKNPPKTFFKKRKTTNHNPVMHVMFCVHVLGGWGELPASSLTNVLTVENRIIVLPSLHFMVCVV